MIVSDIKLLGLDDAKKYASLPFSTSKAIRDTTLVALAHKQQRSHAKFLRHATVNCLVQAPILWWIEFDTYKVGVTRTSTSTMHTLLSNKLDVSDLDITLLDNMQPVIRQLLSELIKDINKLVELNKNNSELLLAVKSILPCSFVYRSYITMSYEALRNMYHDRKNHRLPYWKVFLDSFKDLEGWKEYVL